MEIQRKNKSYDKRQLVITIDKKKYYAEPCCGWFSIDTSNLEIRATIREIVMNNLYWLLGRDCDIETWAEYIRQRNGTLDGQNNYMLDEDNIDNLDVELIRVKTRSGESKFVSKDSTVLDFAFKIHKDLGLGFKYAIVNNSKTKAPPYTKIYEDDQVEIVVDKDENGEILVNAELKWFAYVNTDFAKKVLIKYFEKQQNF